MADKDNINELMGTSGYTEKPAYLESELQKALDIEVDELIGSPPEQGPLTVPASVYDELLQDFEDAVANAAELQDLLSASGSLVEELKAELESCKQTKDACEVLRAAAENSAESVNVRYQELLIDFQQALQKGIKESIERVSLEAQVRGLSAQKVSLIEQVNTLKSQLSDEIESHTANIIAAGERYDELAARQAAGEAIGSGDGTGTNTQQENSSWRLPGSEIVKSGKKLYIETENANQIKVLQGTAINLYNLNDTTSQHFEITVDYQDTKKGWLNIPNEITVPRRDGEVAGKGYVDVQWKPIRTRSGNRNQTHTAYVVIKSSLGDSFRIRADYKKEVRRKDRWDPTPAGGVFAHPGQEKN